MYTNPEMSRLVAAERVRDMHARAEADRRVHQARQARRSGRTRVVRLAWLSRRRAARRPAAGYPEPQET